MKTSYQLPLLGLAALSLITCSAVASTTMSIVADNDFALFVGDSTSITRLIYQNDLEWGSQIEAQQSFTFDLQAGENTFYLVAMGGGGQENISGEINGVNLTSISVLQSDNIATYLSLYDTAAVASGTYTVDLSDAQLALANVAIWGSPTPTDSQTVVQQSGFGTGYTFGDSTAVIYKITAESLNVKTVPEPTTAGLVALGAVSAVAAARLRRSKARR